MCEFSKRKFYFRLHWLEKGPKIIFIKNGVPSIRWFLFYWYILRNSEMLATLEICCVRLQSGREAWVKHTRHILSSTSQHRGLEIRRAKKYSCWRKDQRLRHSSCLRGQQRHRYRGCSEVTGSGQGCLQLAHKSHSSHFCNLKDPKQSQVRFKIH